MQILEKPITFSTSTRCCWRMGGENRRKRWSDHHHHHLRPTSYRTHTWLPLLILSSCMFQGSTGVKDVQLVAPRHVRLSHDIQLTCDYDLETDALYAVKWYRGSDEFYRFIPKEAPPQQIFPMPGLSVDVNKSDDHNVFLRNVSFRTAGRFKCVISAEGTFQTLESAKDIGVIVIDYNSPKLFLDKMSYEPGDKVTANCRLENTYPSPNITWLVNGRQMNISVVTRIEEKESHNMTTMTTPTTQASEATSTPSTMMMMIPTASSGSTASRRKKKPRVTTTWSTLTYPIQSYSPLRIKCRAELYDVYNETSSIRIQPKAPLLYPYPTTRSTSTSAPTLEGSKLDHHQALNASTSASRASPRSCGLVVVTPLFFPLFILLYFEWG